MKKILYVLTATMTILLLSACSSEGDAESKEIISFADAGWDSIRVHNEIAGSILESGFGYDTEVITGSSAATLQGLSEGDIDVYMEVWSYTNREAYQKGIDKGTVQQVSINFDDNSGGYWVPTYVIEGDSERGIEPMAPDLKTVKDLGKYKDLFKDPSNPSMGRVIGAPSSWAVSEIMEEKITTYNLQDQFNYFRAGSDAAIVASLKDAYEAGEPWVGYYWSPTWVTSMYDLTLLEEPPYKEEIYKKNSGTELPSEEVAVAINTNLKKQSPEVVDFLSQYKTSSALTGEALEYMKTNEATPEEAAQWWMKEHEDIWTAWLSDEVVKKVKEEL